MKKLLISSLSVIIVALIIPLFSILAKEKLQVEKSNISNNSEIIESLQPNSTENQADVFTQNPSTSYSDSVNVFFHETGEIKTLSMKDYVTGVVLSEIPASFDVEAIKAQTVIAHTYTLKTIAKEKENPSQGLQGADISTDYKVHQAYCSIDDYKKKQGNNFETNYAKIKDCIDSVFGEILTYDAQPIVASFHAMSSGITESAKNVWGYDIPYLQPADSVGDTLSDTYESNVSFSKEEVQSLVSASYPDVVFNEDPSTWFNIISSTSSGYVDNINLLNLPLTGQDIRKIFSLRSADFTVKYENNTFNFSVNGYGHGVGLSQNGANYMATQGSTYKEILAHYYPNTVLEQA